MSNDTIIILMKAFFLVVRISFIVISAYEHPLYVIPSYLLTELANLLIFGKIIFIKEEVLDHDDEYRSFEPREKNISIPKEKQDIIIEKLKTPTKKKVSQPTSTAEDPFTVIDASLPPSKSVKRKKTEAKSAPKIQSKKSTKNTKANP